MRVFNHNVKFNDESGLSFVKVIWFLVSVPCIFLILIGVGHVATRSGRAVSQIITSKCLIFLQVCLGIWTENAVQLYNIHQTIFLSSTVWANPNVLLRLSEMGKLEKFLQLREKARSGLSWKQSNTSLKDYEHAITYEEVQEFYPALKLKALENKYCKDYQSTLYAMIGMRSTMFQAIPYMTFLSVFAICTAGTPLFIKWESLKKCILPDYVEDCFGEARQMIQERINMEKEIRKIDTNCISQEIIFRKEFNYNETKGIPIYNKSWTKRINSILKNDDNDRINEWEVRLLGIYIYIRENNRIQFTLGLIKFILAFWSLHVKSLKSVNVLTVCILLYTVPYSIYKSIPLFIRIGLSYYITDEEVVYLVLVLKYLIKGPYWVWCQMHYFISLIVHTLCFDGKARKADDSENTKKSNGAVELGIINPIMSATTFTSTSVTNTSNELESVANGDHITIENALEIFHEYFSDDGVPYYYNEVSEENVWEYPKGNYILVLKQHQDASGELVWINSSSTTNEVIKDALSGLT
jgi:hypothetical protein